MKVLVKNIWVGHSICLCDFVVYLLYCRSITAQVKGQSREYAVTSIADNLISQIADHECRIISEEIYQHDVVERIKNMECALKKIQLKRVQYYFEQWRSHYKGKFDHEIFCNLILSIF